VQVTTLELLAPAGNKDIGIAAIDCGADALYIAGSSFGARYGVGNSLGDIDSLCNYAHKFGSKVYLTLNTIIFDNEIGKAISLAWKAYEAGCDALIIQDFGLIDVELPPIPLFASTQTNNRDVQQLKLLESLGFSRAILARELSIEQIKNIRKGTAIELESFIHGALCVSYSGQCYLSARLTGRSANRGECAQPCRSNYNLLDGNGNVLVKNRPLLSLKDLNLSDYIEEMILAGVTSFKIEGRLKNISYVKNIVRHYRGLFDNILEHGTLGDKETQYRPASFGKLYGGFSPRTDLTFNRGYTHFFIEGERGKWQSGHSAKGIGEYIGEVVESWRDNHGCTVFEYKSDISLENGDGLCFVESPNKISGARASKIIGNKVFINEAVDIQEKTKIYRNYSIGFEKELKNNMPKRLLKVGVCFEDINGEYFLEGECEDETVVKISIGANFEVADNQEKAKETIYKQLEKVTDCYIFEVREIRTEKLPFLPVSVLNQGRRDIATQLQRTRPEKRRVKELRSYAKRDVRIGGRLSYRYNIANSYASNLYKSLGAEEIEPAFEISNPSEVELMRCKYCIRYELGFCMKNHSGEDSGLPLYLENNGRTFKLVFDCRNCEMIIFG
jgi:collagenase-like PrtC family protease